MLVHPGGCHGTQEEEGVGGGCHTQHPATEQPNALRTCGTFMFVLVRFCVSRGACWRVLPCTARGGRRSRSNAFLPSLSTLLLTQAPWQARCLLVPPHSAHGSPRPARGDGCVCSAALASTRAPGSGLRLRDKHLTVRHLLHAHVFSNNPTAQSASATAQAATRPPGAASRTPGWEAGSRERRARRKHDPAGTALPTQPSHGPFGAPGDWNTSTEDPRLWSEKGWVPCAPAPWHTSSAAWYTSGGP